MFDNVTCTGSNSSNTIFKAYVGDKFESCINGTEVHNVTCSETGKIEQYCGKKSYISLTVLSLLLTLNHVKMYEHLIQNIFE